MRRCVLLISTMLLFAFGFANEKVTFDNNWADNPLFNVISETPFGMEVIFSTHEMIVEEMDLDEIPMKTYGVPGIFLPNDEGAPNLAGTGRYIAIPQGAKAVVTILDSRKEVYHNVEIAPAPNIPLDSDDSPLRYVKDMEIYNNDAFYPKTPVQVSESEQMRGVDVVVLGITPFQYNPVTKDLIVYKDLRVKLDFIGGNGHFGEDRLRSRFWEPILQGNLLNYSLLPELDFYSAERLDPQDGYGYEYIIIVPDDAVFEAWADTIKNWRRLQGISSEVFTLTEIGGSSADDIKAFLQNAYETWDPAPVAFLLLSDYPSSGDAYGITSNKLYHPSGSWYVTDNWYAEMDNNTLPDLDYARICAQTETQLSTMINKFLNYERSPYTDAGFYSNPLVACAWQTERWFQLCSEVVRGFFINNQSRTPARQYAIYSGTPTVGCAWSTATNTATVVSYWSSLGYIPATNQNDATWWNNGSAAGITAAINSGAFLVQHRDHGSTWGWGEPQYTTTNLNDLTNTMYTFVYSTNCLTGQYDYANEVFAEKFHRIDFGAMGVNAASHVSYSFVNDTYVWGYYDGLWSDFDPGYPSVDMTGHDNLRPCQAMTYGKYYLSASGWPYNSNRKTVTYRLFHHHGDAFSVLYSEIPQTLTVSHTATLTAGATSFTVTADDSSVIALTVNYEIIGVVEGTGSPVAIPITPQVPGNTMKVTVTKANHYRYEADVSIVYASGPYPMATTTIIDDATGNNDGVVNPGETIEYGIYLQNVGDATAYGVYAYLIEDSPYITVNTDSTWYGDIASDDSTLSDPYYNFTVANNCPNNHTVACSLAIYDNAKALYVSYLSFMVKAPILVYENYSITNDNNGDGRLDPGETADIIMTIRNNGDATAQNITSTLETGSSYITINDASGNFGNLDPHTAGDNSSDPYNITASSTTPQGALIEFSVIIQAGVYCDTFNFNVTVTPSGYLLDTTLAYSPPEFGQNYPKIAFGSTVGLAVWQDSRNGVASTIYGARITPSGEMIDTLGFVISLDDNYSDTYPEIAWDGTNFLVVWEDSHLGNGKDIYGARVTEAGIVLDPGGFLISGASGNQYYESVAFNGTNYLVAWHDRRVGSIEQQYCARVTPGGIVLDPNGIYIASTWHYFYSALTSNGSDWFFVWDDLAGVVNRGARIAADGTVLDPGSFIIGSGTNDRYFVDVDFDGTNYFVVWQDQRGGTWDIYGARVAQNGTVLDPSGIPIANTADGERIPRIAFNGENYLVSYKHDQQIGGRRVTPAGVVIDSLSRIAISQVPMGAHYHDITSYNDNWISVWEDKRYEYAPTHGPAQSYDIVGARIDSSGTVLDLYPNDIPVALVASWQYESRSAFNGTDYLLVWEERREGTWWDIYGARMSSNGTPLDDPFIISAANQMQLWPEVCCGDSNYLVVWNDRRNPPHMSIYGARVDFNGNVLDPTGINLTGTMHQNTGVAFDGTNYMVLSLVWSADPWCYKIYARQVNQDGVPIGSFKIANTTRVTGLFDHISPSLAFDGTNYLVVWADYLNGNYDIYGVRFTPAGVVLDTIPFLVCRSAGTQDLPRLTFGGDKYFAVWHDTRGDGNDVYGVSIDPSGISYDTTGMAISSEVGEQSQSYVSFDGSKYVVVWTDSRNGDNDIYCARISTDGTVLDPHGIEVAVEEYNQSYPCIGAGPNGKVLITYSGYTEAPYCATRLYYQPKETTTDNVPPLVPCVYAEKAGAGSDDIRLIWDKVTTDTLGNAETMDHYAVYRSTSPDFIPGASDSIAGIAHPDTVFTDTGVLDSLQSYYYLVKAVDQSDNKSTKSNMAYKLNKAVIENTSATDKNWVSLSWHSGYSTVSDLTTDLSSAGDPLVKLTNLRDDQLYENYTWTTVPFPHWAGTNFTIDPGRGYETVTINDTILPLVGSNNPNGLIDLIYNATATDKNWVAIPYNAAYSTVSDITTEYSSAGDPLVKLTNLRNDQLYENYTWTTVPFPHWSGTDFTIEPGRGYEFVVGVSHDTVWNPTEYTNESGFDRLAARQKKSDVKVRLGTLTKADRAPLWFVEEAASKKTISRAETEDPKKEACSAMPKSEKSVKSADEHDARVYKPVSRSVSSKKRLKLYREVGVSHVVRAYFELEECSNIVFTAYRLNNPHDVLTERVVGCGVEQWKSYGAIWFDVGNFMKPWYDGEAVILIIEALHEDGAYYQVLKFELDQRVDIQGLGKLELEPMPVPKPVLNTAVSWPKSRNEQVIGYSIYQGELRKNHEVIQTHEYSSSKNITLKPVIKGGYETVYSSGSKRTAQGPVVDLPRVYAFTVYPNPFIKKTVLDYALPEPGQISIMVYDVTGRKVRTLVNGRVDPGYYQIHWSGCDDLGRQVSAGVYFMRMNTPGFNFQQKVIFVR